MEDWRLNGQEKYLQGATLYKIVFPQFWLKAVTERNSFYEMTAECARRFADQMQRGEEYLKGDKIRNLDRKSTRLNSSHTDSSRMPSSA